MILDVEENTKLKAEIERLKEVRNKYGLLLEMYDKRQKEIDRLKSELEQSVKLPLVKENCNICSNGNYCLIRGSSDIEYCSNFKLKVAVE